MRYKMMKGWLFAFVFLLLCLSGESQSDNQVNALVQQGQAAEQQNELNEAVRAYSKAAVISWNKNMHEDAITYFLKCQELNKQLGNENGVGVIYSQLALVYTDMGNATKAREYTMKALNFRKQQGDREGQTSELLNLAMLERSDKNYEGSNTHANEALTLAKETGNRDQIKQAYGIIAENYQSLGNNEKAFEYFNIYQTLQKEQLKKEAEQNEDKVNKAEYRARSAETQIKKAEEELVEKEIALTEQEAQIKLLNQEKQLKELALKEQEARSARDTIIRNTIIIITLLAIIFAIVVLRGFLSIRKAKAMLELQNQEIQERNQEIRNFNVKLTASINYAKRIQEAMLPDIDEIREHLPHSFVLFKPKDIVSGDFYWFQHQAGLKNEFTDIKSSSIIAAIDCTGHGVPGAFMSMMGKQILSRIVTAYGITTADGILNNLHKEIRSALRQDTTDNKDGMDLALCVYNKELNLLTYAGAKNPIVYIQNDELNFIKGDRMPIGGIKEGSERRFTSHQIKITTPTWVYLFSDGFQDQFGGENGRKYSFKRLSEKLLEIHDLSMPEQKMALEAELDRWQGSSHKQVDDILLIGFKIWPTQKA